MRAYSPSVDLLRVGLLSVDEPFAEVREGQHRGSVQAALNPVTLGITSALDIREDLSREIASVGQRQWQHTPMCTGCIYRP
jgi:hypothetical protein